MTTWIADFSYLSAAVLFILGVKKLSSVRTAGLGNRLATFGMLLAIVVTLFVKGVVNYQMIIGAMLIGSVIGAVMARTVKMTAMPQLVALFNGFGGIASALVAASEFVRGGSGLGSFVLVTIALGSFVGSLTFTGSLIAYAKLQGLVSQQPVTYPLQKTFNLVLAIVCVVLTVLVALHPEWTWAFWQLVFFASLLGVLLVLPIGGADMPVVISLLNSYSGIAASMTGFVLMNKVLIVAGAIVGATGIILTEIMCRAMNRSLLNVAFGAFGKTEEGEGGAQANSDYENIKKCSAEEVAMIMDGAQSVIIVPGYGLAVARAQHAIKELAEELNKKGITVKYAIHPVAGRMPGHMNVLLAEADVPYEHLYEMDEINSEFDQTDVALVVGANDVTNPSAKDSPGSPIYGMPILNVENAKSIIVVKRSLSAGFAGIKNPLYENDKTLMFFGDAKGAMEDLVKEVKAL